MPYLKSAVARLSRRYSYDFGSLMLVTGLLFASYPATAEQDPSVVILFGDSITVGYNLEEGFSEDYGSGRTLSQMSGSRPLSSTDAVLNQVTPSYPSIIVNWGVGGSTTADGVSRITSSIITTKGQYSAEDYFVLILYGTNDIGSGLSSSTTAFNIRQMITKVRQQGASFTPIVANLLPRDDRDVIPANSQIEPEVLSDNTVFVDMYAAFINYPGGYTQLLGQETNTFNNTLIRLHPNVTGYQVIAQTWFDQALALLVPAEIIPDPPPVLSPILMLLLDDQPVPP